MRKDYLIALGLLSLVLPSSGHADDPNVFDLTSSLGLASKVWIDSTH